jgi:hypothetical protein
MRSMSWGDRVRKALARLASPVAETHIRSSGPRRTAGRAVTADPPCTRRCHAGPGMTMRRLARQQQGRDGRRVRVRRRGSVEGLETGHRRRHAVGCREVRLPPSRPARSAPPDLRAPVGGLRLGQGPDDRLHLVDIGRRDVPDGAARGPGRGRGRATVGGDVHRDGSGTADVDAGARRRDVHCGRLRRRTPVVSSIAPRLGGAARVTNRPGFTMVQAFPAIRRKISTPSATPGPACFRTNETLPKSPKDDRARLVGQLPPFPAVQPLSTNASTSTTSAGRIRCGRMRAILSRGSPVCPSTGEPRVISARSSSPRRSRWKAW